MGRGKTTAAINYINAHKRETRFLYVTPFLTEVARIRQKCGIEEPSGEEDHTKLSELRGYLYAGKSVSLTHSLYLSMDDEMLDVVKDRRYTLIIDETISTVDKPEITAKDRKILDDLTVTDENGVISWIDEDYSGKFDEYKKLADHASLYRVDTTMINTVNVKLFSSFDQVFIMTYLFRGSIMEAYFRCFNLPYEIWGVGLDSGITDSGIIVGSTVTFVPGNDDPPAVDYRKLITIVDNQQMNEVGDYYTALSMNWYANRPYHSPDICKLRRGMQNFFKNITHSKKCNRLWTCFKDHHKKLIPDDGSYAANFLQIASRATNKYVGCSNLAYMVNRFYDPNLMKFLASKGCMPDHEQCAISDMLQWIWRSAVRDDKPINLYIPSKRMRDLLTRWMDMAADGVDIMPSTDDSTFNDSITDKE